MPDEIRDWPFQSKPSAWGKREYEDSVYIFGVFEPESRKNDRHKRVIVVTRYFINAGRITYEVIYNGTQLPSELKKAAQDYEATYPASIKEHVEFLQLAPNYQRSQQPAFA